MKKKVIVFTLCFTILFSSINFDTSYADGGVISLPILATVSAAAVGAGIIIKNNDDLYDLGRIFYDYVKSHNSLTWDVVKSTFFASVSVLNNGLVSVKSDFLDIVKDFLDVTFSVSSDVGFIGDIPLYPGFSTLRKSDFNNGWNYFDTSVDIYDHSNSLSKLQLVTDLSSNFYYFGVSAGNVWSNCTISSSVALDDIFRFCFVEVSNGYQLRIYNGDKYNTVPQVLKIATGVVSFPYQGGYSWDNLENKKENGDLPLPIPSDLGELVGQTSDDFWSNTDNLVGNGDLLLPNIDNPSIEIDKSDSFPNSGVQDACSECGMVGTHSSTCSKVNISNPPVGLPEFPSWGEGIDFSPITESDISDKFPFCLAKDISNLISVFDVGEKAPIFDVPFLGEVYQIDLAQFTVWADIIKFFTLLGFIFGLIKITRGIIG